MPRILMWVDVVPDSPTLEDAQPLMAHIKAHADVEETSIVEWQDD